jgi:branched-chain amino acid transport system substrate-binding protein
MSKNAVWGIVVALIIIAAIVFATHKSTAPTDTTPIKIGVSSLMTGDFAVLGENILNSAKLAVAEVNKSGGINGRQLELVVEDAGYDSKTGLAAAQKLINADGIKYIIGGTSSNGTLAAAPIVNQNHAVYLTPVTGGKNIDDAGEYVFRIANSDIHAGTDLAQEMLKLGYKNVGVVSAQTEYTVDIENTFKKAIVDAGGTVVISEEFAPGTTDYRTMVTKVRTKKPQAILILSQLGTDAAQFIKQAKEAGFNPPLFTDFTLATNGTVKTILGSLDGIYFADPSYATANPKTTAFFGQYKEAYKTDSAIPFHAASTYDGVMMLAQALKAVGDDSVKVQQYLSTQIKDYHGLMGVYSLDAAGNSDLGFTVRVIKNGKPTDI